MMINIRVNFHTRSILAIAHPNIKSTDGSILIPNASHQEEIPTQNEETLVNQPQICLKVIVIQHLIVF